MRRARAKDGGGGGDCAAIQIWRRGAAARRPRDHALGTLRRARARARA